MGIVIGIGFHLPVLTTPVAKMMMIMLITMKDGGWGDATIAVAC